MNEKFEQALTKPRKVALYARMGESTWFTVFEVNYSKHDEHYSPLPEGQLREMPYEAHARISEPVALEFTSTDKETMVRNAVESLNEQERKLIEQMNEQLAKIREQKTQLLALTHESAS